MATEQRPEVPGDESEDSIGSVKWVSSSPTDHNSPNFLKTEVSLDNFGGYSACPVTVEIPLHELLSFVSKYVD